MPVPRRAPWQAAAAVIGAVFRSRGRYDAVGGAGLANTKAAYRFFANGRISEANILAGHFVSTRERCVATSGFPLLVLHDTTELSYRHKDTAPIGIVMKTVTGASKPGRPRYHTSCGVLMHSSLVTTRRLAAGVGGDQVLEPGEVSWRQSPEAQD